MFLKLTNATKEHKGKFIILHSRYIVSIYPAKDEEGKTMTVIYGALQSAWNVKESVEKIWEMLANDELSE